MLGTDGYLRLAASNFKIAEAHLVDAERELHKLVERLENCSKLMSNIPKDQILLWEQIDTIVQANQPAQETSGAG